MHDLLKYLHIILMVYYSYSVMPSICFFGDYGNKAKFALGEGGGGYNWEKCMHE